MNGEKIKKGFQRFISNPNTLTFILVIGLIILVYCVYDYLIGKAVEPINVPYANQLIKENTQITREMIGTVKISGGFVSTSSGLIQNTGEIIDKYVAKGYQIPQYSFIYKEQLTNAENANDTVFANIPEGYTIYALKVSFDSTYGCSIMDKDYIDIYFKGTDEDRKIMFTNFIKSIQVLQVVDKDGYDVFKNTEEGAEPKPDRLFFAVPDEYATLLRNAETLSGTELIPVPRNAEYSENPEDTSIASSAVVDYINSHVKQFQ
jgi:hypothetical protein